MKARIKAIGDVVDVTHSHNITSGGIVMKKIYKDQLGNEYSDSELEFLQEGKYIPDYWTRLEHKYAGMAMQGILSNPSITGNNLTTRKGIIEDSERLAHALVEKLKEKEERK